MPRVDYDQFLHDVKNLPDQYISKKYGIVINSNGTVFCVLTKTQHANIMHWLNTTNLETNEYHLTAD